MFVEKSRINTRSRLSVSFYSVNISLLSLMLQLCGVRHPSLFTSLKLRFLLHASGSGAPASHSAARLEPHPSSRSPPALTAVSRGAPSGGQEVCSKPGGGVGLRERWPGDFVVLFVCFPGSLAKILGDHMPEEY